MRITVIMIIKNSENNSCTYSTFFFQKRPCFILNVFNIIYTQKEDKIEDRSLYLSDLALKGGLALNKASDWPVLNVTDSNIHLFLFILSPK